MQKCRKTHGLSSNPVTSGIILKVKSLYELIIVVPIYPYCVLIHNIYIIHSLIFLNIFIGLNWHTKKKNYKYLKCKFYYVLMYIFTHETTSMIKLLNIPITLKSFLVSLLLLIPFQIKYQMIFTKIKWN